jgi:ribosomal protein S16
MCVGPAKLFDKLGWWNEIVETISSENQIKLERVYVRMPRHQEPTKDVAKLRKARVDASSRDPGVSEIRKRHEVDPHEPCMNP